MIIHSSPLFNFTPAQCFTISHQSQLAKGGILTKIDKPQVQRRILKNALTSLHSQLKPGYGRLYTVNLQFKISYFRVIMDSDLAITSPHKTFAAQHPDIWHNPVVIIEVLSPEARRDQKFKLYRPLASLHEYVRIDPARYLIEHIVRQPTKEWKESQIENWEDVLHLASIDCELSLAAVYDKVKV